VRRGFIRTLGFHGDATRLLRSAHRESGIVIEEAQDRVEVAVFPRGIEPRNNGFDLLAAGHVAFPKPD
jgi:hypothetical protein